MSKDVISYRSGEQLAPTLPYTFEKVSAGAVDCTWTVLSEASLDPSSGTKKEYLIIKWKFEWNELKKSIVAGFKGQITTFHKNLFGNDVPSYFTIEQGLSGQRFEKKIEKLERVLKNSTGYFVKCEFALTPIYEVTDVYRLEQNFKSLPLTDSVLVVEDKKIHVNKVFLSCQSEYFNTLFNMDSKEKNADEITIKDVKYEDFALLLSVIHWNPIPPTDFTAPKILEMADQFMMPAVTCHVESYLLGSSLGLTEKFRLADKYNLKRLVEKCASELKTQRDMERITGSEHYKTFTTETQSKILQRYLTIV